MAEELFALATFELYHSRPIAPTRRLALGLQYLPANPPPGPGGTLLAGIVAHYVERIDDDDLVEVEALLPHVEAGQRIVQPRVRHRLQTDRIGLLKTVHRLTGRVDQPGFDFGADLGSPLVNVLGAVYAAGNLPYELRGGVFVALRRALHWRGPVDASFVADLTGGGERPGWWATSADPVAWALEVLGFPPGGDPSKREVRKQFREQLRLAHPDHGADEVGAADRIADLAEARRILLGS